MSAERCSVKSIVERSGLSRSGSARSAIRRTLACGAVPRVQPASVRHALVRTAAAAQLRKRTERTLRAFRRDSPRARFGEDAVAIAPPGVVRAFIAQRDGLLQERIVGVVVAFAALGAGRVGSATR